MPSMWMDVDQAVVVPVNIMPLINDTDFKTIDETIAWNESGMDLNWNFVTTAGAVTQTNVTPTTGDDHDWAHEGNGMYSIEIPASGGDADNDTEGFGWFSGICDAVLPWRGPVIGFRAVATNNSLVDGATIDVNVTAMAANVVTAAAVAAAAIDNATFAADVGSTAYATNIIALAGRKALDEIKLDHLVAVADADDAVNDSLIAKLASTDGDWSNYSETTDSQQSIRDALATAAKLLAYVQLLARSDDAIETDNAAEVTEINADGGSGAGDWSNETDSGEGIRDRGDQAWVTGGGGGATEEYTSNNYTRTVGDNDGGAAADTVSVNGTYFATGETNAGTYLEVDVIFTIGAGETAETMDFWGFYAGGGAHRIDVQALDTATAEYEPVGSIGLGSIVQKQRFTFSPGHTNGTTVTIKFIHGGGVGNASHVFNVDKLQVNTIAPVTSDGSGLTAIPWNAAWDAEVESECNDALVAYPVPTVAQMNARTLVAADYFDPAADTVVDVTTVGTVTNAVTVGTNNDKTGYTLSVAGLAAFFLTDSGTNYAASVAGSVVQEIASNAAAGAVTVVVP